MPHSQFYINMSVGHAIFPNLVFVEHARLVCARVAARLLMQGVSGVHSTLQELMHSFGRFTSIL